MLHYSNPLSDNSGSDPRQICLYGDQTNPVPSEAHRRASVAKLRVLAGLRIA